MGVTLLVVDDDAACRRLVKAIFASEDFVVVGSGDGESGLHDAAAVSPDVVLLDLGLPDLDGLSVLERLKQDVPGLPVIVLTGRDDVKVAVRATQLGAVEYLIKPVDPDEILLAVRRTLKTRRLETEVAHLRRKVAAGGQLAIQMGPSPEVREIVEHVKIVSTSNLCVLVTGETGTGKELVAQAIHRESDRRDRPLVAVDCGAIPDSLLESELFGHERGAFTGASQRKAGQLHVANGGTFFLDEIGNMTLGLQAKLLRVLESRQIQAVGATRPSAIDLRFVAATNDDLRRRVKDGRFRADLFFRLAQYTIKLPPLRARPSDVPHLAARFLEEASVEMRRPVQRLDPNALERLQRHPWPGNVRELRNLIRQAVLQARGLSITADVVQNLLGRPSMPAVPLAVPLHESSLKERSLREIAQDAARCAERHAICTVLHATRGNKSQAARILKTDYKTLHLKMKSLGIRHWDFTP